MRTPKNINPMNKIPILPLWIAIFIFGISGFSEQVWTIDKQRIIILPFQNIDHDPNYEYLSSTITDTIRSSLKNKFVFSETPQKEWKKALLKNYLYEKDAYTESFGMNLGLATKQDVVINGGYYVHATAGGESRVNTLIRIISITERKTISEVTVIIPANSQLFSRIDEIAKKASKEAAKVLPNKEEYKKNKYKRIGKEKIFSNLSLNIFGGVNFLIAGWADQFTPKLPILTGAIKANMPVIWEKMFLEINFAYYSYELNSNSSAGNYLLANNLSMVTTNYLVGGYIGIDFPIGLYFFLSPKIGGGMIFQNSQISGAVSQSLRNGFPFAGGGFEFGYVLNDFIKIVLDGVFLAQIENQVVTLMPVVQLGINIKF